MKTYIIIVLILLVYYPLFAQQPRMAQVESYLTDTGIPVETPSPVYRQQQYCLPMKDYKEGITLKLDIPFFKEKGVRAVMPFGFTLNSLSEIEMNLSVDNMQESKPVKMQDDNFFSTISYLFCDSTLYGVKLYLANSGTELKTTIEEELTAFFSGADYANSRQSVWSDEEFAVKYDHINERIEIYSLFHYPVTAFSHPGVMQQVCYGPCWFDLSENESVMLGFMNQTSKENNVQSAFKVYYRGNDKIGFREINFILDDHQVVSFPLKQDIVEQVDDQYMERDTRVFIFREEMQKILRSGTVQVTIVGDYKTISYQLPAFQRYSLYTMYEYFRWHSTNPMVKYRGF